MPETPGLKGVDPLGTAAQLRPPTNPKGFQLGALARANATNHATPNMRVGAPPRLLNAERDLWHVLKLPGTLATTRLPR